MRPSQCPVWCPKTSLLKGGEYPKQVSKTTSKFKKKSTYSRIWEQGHGFPPIYQKHTSKISTHVSASSGCSVRHLTPKKSNQTSKYHRLFFSDHPRSCAARDFGMLSYSKLCKGLTKTSWIFTQPRWIGRFVLIRSELWIVLIFFLMPKILSRIFL